jgi:hypothetical protein
MAASPAALSPTAIWQGILAALRPDFATLFALVAPFTLLVSMAIEVFGPAPPTTLAEFTPRVAVMLLLIPSIVGAIGQLALTWLLVTPGGTPRGALARALKALPVYLLAVLIVTPLTSLGLVLLIVPGVYLFARLLLVAPLVVVEGLGATAALRRSLALTATHGWTIFWFLLLAILFVLGASVVASGIGAALAVVLTALGLKSVGGFVAALVAAIISTLFTMASAAAATVIYLQLRTEPMPTAP